MDPRQDVRQQRLTKQFNAILKGRKELTTARDSDLYLESIIAEPQASTCVEKIAANPPGLNALRLAIRSNLSPDYINGRVAEFLRYIQEPSIKLQHSGQLLRTIVTTITDPPTLWLELLKLHRNGLLKENGTQALAWLLFELLSSDEPQDFLEIAKEVTGKKDFTDSQNVEIRTLGHKIKHCYEVLTGAVSSGGAKGESSPGGRHDNDFVDFRQISILPTSAELSSPDEPFFRTTGYLVDENEEDKPAIHLDNQFRLLREDFLGELRSDLQKAITGKRYRKNTALSGISFVGVTCGSSTRRRQCGLKLRTQYGLVLHKNWDKPQFDHDARVKYLRENRDIVRHQSIGCLLNNGEIVAFGTIDRDEDLLAELIVVLQIWDEQAFMKSLLALKTTANPHSFQLLVMDTALFAYEPILKRLQDIKQFPLSEELVHLREIPATNNDKITKIIGKVQDEKRDLLKLLDVRKSFKLDTSQENAILDGLLKRVSLIQGPPGKQTVSLQYSTSR